MSEIFNLNNYFFNWYAIPPAVVTTLIFATGLFVFIQNRNSPTNRSLFLFCLSLNLWLYGIALVYSSRSENIALWWYRWVVFLGVSHISPLVYTFSVHWLGLYQKRKSFVWASFILAPIFYIIAVTTPYGMPFLRKYFWGFYPAYGIAGQIFLAFFFGYFLAAFFNFFSAIRKESDPLRKKQIQLITLAYLISITGSVDYLPKLVPLNIYPVGFLSVLIWTLIAAYSIVKYKAMEIETVIHRTILWLVTSSIVILPIIGIFYTLKNWYQEANAGIFALFISALFFVFFFYLKTVQPRIDHWFKRREIDLERALIKFNDALVHLKDLAELSNYIVQTIREVLYVDKVQIFLKHGDNGHLIRVDGEMDGGTEVSCKGAFIEWLEKQDRLTLVDYVDLDPRFETVRNEAKNFFHSLNVKVVVPLVLNQELIGLINLGQKASLKSFRAAEIIFLSGLRRAVTIALSNSLRLIEMQENLRKWNEELEKRVKQRTAELEQAQKQLIQAEKLATIGTLAGGVAHEINNPLTAVLTNAQLLKMSAANSDDVESISLIEEGAKRCQTIVQKLMKYARKPAAGDLIKEVDLNTVIENMLGFVGYQLEQENIQLIKRLNPVSKIKGISNELEQVFTNILLNAKDAIKAGTGKGTVEIETFEKTGSVCTRIKDNGIGISQENISKIFDPFFTTKDIGKGTGLGLSVTYGIIEKHSGTIKVESHEGKGSSFIVSLPKVDSKTVSSFNN